MLRFFSYFFIFVLFASLSLWLCAWWWYRHQLAPVEEFPPQMVTLVIPSASTTQEIAVLLKKNKLIRNELAFRFYARWTDTGTRLQAGTFTLSTEDDIPTLVKKLQSNQTGIRITIIEGWRREQIAEMFDVTLAKEGLDFDVQAFLSKTESLEGSLFPDTYILSQSTNVDEIIATINNNFIRKAALIWESATSPLSREEIIVLASLLERETATDSDFGLVSGVIHNRLKIGQALQIDATLQHAKASLQCKNTTVPCASWWPTPFSEDKALESPFNTYLYPGLPPKAISNPGLRAFMAAANPTDSDYFYYLTDQNGVTYYSVTYEEHLRKIDRYLR